LLCELKSSGSTSPLSAKQQSSDRKSSNWPALRPMEYWATCSHGMRAKFALLTSWSGDRRPRER
jgi:hypothetical protein